MPDQTQNAALTNRARLLTILRGTLAEPSGCSDCPWHRVLLKKMAPSADTAAKALSLPELGSETGDKELRAALQAILQQAKPRLSQVSLPDGSCYLVERGAVGASAPLQNEIAVVTGAAGAIGAGICRGLLAKGAYVAATVLAPEPVANLVAELEAFFPGRVIGVTMDVSAEASVAAGFDAVAEAWGGVDIVVVNAGIAMVAPLVELGLEEFRKLERVNVEGVLLTLAQAGRRLRRQATGGDIILISTKNVFAPGAEFGAYSATKAAGHQLARIASLELAGFDIRVNMVAPDAVFGEGERRSGLWETVGPARMFSRGLDQDGLEKYYRNRNLLKARVTPEHVANAVLFFATRQTPTTGATLPVDGGLPDSTPR